MIVHNFVDLELFECLALPLETEFLTISTPPSFRGNPEHLNELDAQVTPESTEDASKNNIDSKHMKKEIKELIVSRNEPMMKGHTSYLYFATLPPLSE